MSRSARKVDHINHALLTGQALSHGFEDVKFVHNSIPEINVDEINLSSKIGELTLSSPIFINAMTGGGGKETTKINQQLAEVAAETDIAMAVGSQMAAIKDKEQQPSYTIVRKVNPKGMVIANLGSEASIDQARQAVEMLEANAFQLHVNVIQELVMPEGDRNYAGTFKRIEELVHKLEVPVIVKEVGFGMSQETIKRLAAIGVEMVDIGGFGGTNFSKIENKRRDRQLRFFDNWGIPTTASLLEVHHANTCIDVLASGGMQTALDLAKSLALGARAGGFAGYFLKILKEDGQEALINEITDLKEDLTMILTALDVKSPHDLTKVPLVFSGETYQWACQRGIDIQSISTR
ncbi:type 2 isopentenyl-diphosphate Delta-isomerase [Halalkalibacter krulwichiae]|uniref:Isopentenyl-diphosphate delta-isomerase n=1 Tax=Halalkalibacter krulwichiae TaxID=199441 RepID=A0A1X9MCH3_9BACI|nr:type 2 isopentenyl-diphosphate Delta-isomerase [Halalkalibacter krulwichiae]ARK30290.1 Isopentenyl-diphosphate delta-isomerase [Halalkalibacter krulwichiae]